MKEENYLYKQTGLQEKDVIKIMRTYMKPSSFRMWRKRVHGRKAKHLELSKARETKGKTIYQLLNNTFKIHCDKICFGRCFTTGLWFDMFYRFKIRFHCGQ